MAVQRTPQLNSTKERLLNGLFFVARPLLHNHYHPLEYGRAIQSLVTKALSGPFQGTKPYHGGIPTSLRMDSDGGAIDLFHKSINVTSDDRFGCVF